MRDPGAEPRLAVPEGLVIDENVRERMVRGLSLAPADVAGIGAEIADLVPGASYRVHAEWIALRRGLAAELSGAEVATRSSVRGAALVRPGIELAIRNGAVELANDTVVIDPGAHVHDPHRSIGPLQPASERGRPPFPRRPVVVFLAVNAPATAIGCAGS